MRSRPLISGLAPVFLIGCGEVADPAPPPPEVQTVVVSQHDVPIYAEFTGQTRGSKEVEIRARVDGYLDDVHFAEGTFVENGQLLYTIDPRPFEIAVAQAKARLAGTEAELGRARQDVARFKPLVDENAIPRQDYETALSRQQGAQAAVESARAEARQAELDLAFTRIAAPMDGLVGKNEVNPGNLVNRQSTLLTSISHVDPIHVRFSISEQEHLRYSRAYPLSESGTPAQPLELILSDGSLHPHGGRVAFIDRTVDPSTGTLLIEAAFPNPERLTRPGQFGRVRATVETRAGAILVPQRAVQELQATYTVAVVGADDTVEIRPVTPGPRIDAMWIIEQGLAAGERVVVEGLQKVRSGVTVKVVPAAAPGT